MNNAKMWLVVKPTVGVPLFLSAVAVGSFAVHVAVLSNTSWVDDFLQGVPMGSGDMAAAGVLNEDAPAVSNAGYAMPMGDGVHEVTIIMPDGTATQAILRSNEVLASAELTPLAPSE